MVRAGTEIWQISSSEPQSLREYLQREILIREQILAGLDGKENRRIEQRRTELKKELEEAQKGMDYYAV